MLTMIIIYFTWTKKQEEEVIPRRRNEEQGQPRVVVRESDSSSVNWFDNLLTKSTMVLDRRFGGTQNDEPGMNGSQSGLDFCTTIRWIMSSNFFIASASTSLTPSDEDDAGEEEEAEESRSISTSWALCERWRLSESEANGCDLRDRRRRCW